MSNMLCRCKISPQIDCACLELVKFTRNLFYTPFCESYLSKMSDDKKNALKKHFKKIKTVLIYRAIVIICERKDPT